MGSSGYGAFGNYRLGSNGGENGEFNSTNGTGRLLGNGGNERACPPQIEFIKLEDVATSEYYIMHQSVPSPGDVVELADSIYNGRLVVILSSTREILGNLPTKFNYLIECIKNGVHYTGDVHSSGVIPVPYILVNLYA